MTEVITEVDTSKPTYPGFIVLGRSRTDNAYQGIVEHSFSMGLSPDRVRFNWSGKARDNIVGAIHDLDGYKDSMRDKAAFEKSYPDMEFTIFDVDDPNLPVIIDWAQWHIDCQPADTLSGVKHKYGARNPKFIMKD